MDAIITENTGDAFSPADRAMVRYAIKLTRLPDSIREEDIQELRQRNFSDRAILEINLAASYMNFVNRVALGLGVELEDSLLAFKR